MNRIRELSADEETRRLALCESERCGMKCRFLNDAKRGGSQEGRRHAGVKSTLRKQIALKFGELPDWADERLASATDE